MKTKEWEDQPGSGMMKINCPGCKTAHTIFTKVTERNNVIWGFNGDLNKPTFTPSVKITWPEEQKQHCCHFHINEGRIEFCGDCTHELSGKVFELTDV